MLSHPEGFVLIWENRIITASQFLLKEKNRKHVNFLSSALRRVGDTSLEEMIHARRRERAVIE